METSKLSEVKWLPAMTLTLTQNYMTQFVPCLFLFSPSSRKESMVEFLRQFSLQASQFFSPLLERLFHGPSMRKQ